MAEPKPKTDLDTALAGGAPTADEVASADATPHASARDAELLGQVQAVNEGRASADDLDGRRTQRVLANVNIAGIAAGSTGYVPRDAETAAQLERGLLSEAPAE